MFRTLIALGFTVIPYFSHAALVDYVEATDGDLADSVLEPLTTFSLDQAGINQWRGSASAQTYSNFPSGLNTDTDMFMIETGSGIHITDIDVIVSNVESVGWISLDHQAEMHESSVAGPIAYYEIESLLTPLELVFNENFPYTNISWLAWNGMDKGSCDYPSPSIVLCDASWDWQLTITTSEVPVPAAAWLFGSALLGVGLLGRRRD